MKEMKKIFPLTLIRDFTGNRQYLYHSMRNMLILISYMRQLHTCTACALFKNNVSLQNNKDDFRSKYSINLEELYF